MRGRAIRRILFAVTVTCFYHQAFGARLVSNADPTGAADKCVYQVGTAPAVESPVIVIAPTLTGSCDIQLDSFANGVHNLQVWFRSTVWGVDSAKVPFAFTKPAAGFPGPTGLKIQP